MSLYGFGVYSRATGNPVEFMEYYMITPDGKLLRTHYAGEDRVTYDVVPAEGKLLVQYGAGDIEVY